MPFLESSRAFQRRLAQRTLTALLLLVAAAFPAGARETRLAGRVLDDLGNAIAEAHVLIIPADPTRPVTSVTSDSRGLWLKEGLQEGVYRLVAAKKGYSSALRAPMALPRDQDASIELKLAPVQAVSRTRGRDLAWLVRALSGDVLRLTPEGELPAGSDWPGDATLAGSDAMLERLGLAIRGHLELAALETGAVAGNSTNLSLTGGASAGLSWEVLGQRDERNVTHSDYQDALASDALRYSVSFEPRHNGTLQFDGRHRSSELRVSGSAIEELSTSEDMSSYSMAWLAGSPDDSLRALEFNYSVAESGRGTHSKDSHELFLTRGSYIHALGDGQRLSTQLELSAQSFTRPNGTLLGSPDSAAALPLGSAQLVPASWSVRASSQYDWQLDDRLRLTPGVNLFEVSDAVYGDLVRPHLNMALRVTPDLELGSELALAFAEGFEGARQYAYGMRLNASLGANRRLGLAFRRNGQGGDAYLGPYASLNQTTSDFYLVPDGLVATSELVLELDGGLGELALGRFRTVVGEAEGDLIVAPRSDQSLDRALRHLRSRRVHYVLTSVGTTWRPTETDVDLSYQWTDGLTPVESEFDSYSRVDLQVRQSLPFLLAATRMQLVFNMRNYFARPELLAQRGPDGVLSLDPATRSISGGVAINF